MDTYKAMYLVEHRKLNDVVPGIGIDRVCWVLE